VGSNNTTNECLKGVNSITSRSILKNFAKFFFTGESKSKLCLNEEINFLEEPTESTCDNVDKLKSAYDQSLVKYRIGVNFRVSTEIVEDKQTNSKFLSNTNCNYLNSTSNEEDMMSTMQGSQMNETINNKNELSDFKNVERFTTP
jgi:mRNA-degrading endonuclease RelE of RelBE toxin-antitoxin system